MSDYSEMNDEELWREAIEAEERRRPPKCTLCRYDATGCGSGQSEFQMHCGACGGPVPRCRDCYRWGSCPPCVSRRTWIWAIDCALRGY